MALKISSTGHYLKVDLLGNYVIYETQADREAEKAATKFEVIRKKYRSIIQQLRQDKERIYYDPAFKDLIRAWEAEYEFYIRSHAQGLANKKFPLITQYIEDPEKSLPQIISIGQVRVRGATLQEVYEYLKHGKFFGEVEDC